MLADMKKVLIYPGAFNPPHNGHVATLELALKDFSFDEVWIIPSGKRKDKTIPIDYEHRRNMGNLFVEYLQTKMATPIKLVTAELDDTAGRETGDVLKEIRLHSGADIAQLSGLDGFLNIKKDIDETEKFIIVVNRAGYTMEDPLIVGDNPVIVDENLSDVSSTQIREMIQRGDIAYKKLLPPEIAEYIEAHNLYK